MDKFDAFKVELKEIVEGLGKRGKRKKERKLGIFVLK